MMIECTFLILNSFCVYNYYCHFFFQASGGSGKYQWSSDTVDVVGVSRVGVVTSVTTGKAIVTVSDIRNTDHYDQTLVSSVGILIQYHYDQTLVSSVGILIQYAVNVMFQVYRYCQYIRSLLIPISLIRTLQIQAVLKI